MQIHSHDRCDALVAGRINGGEQRLEDAGKDYMLSGVVENAGRSDDINGHELDRSVIADVEVDGLHANEKALLELRDVSARVSDLLHDRLHDVVIE